MRFYLVYLLIISVISIIITVIDKHNAQLNRYRISERTLFTTAVFGGSLAMLITMHSIRHKTKHKRFMIGLPVIIACQAVLFYIIFIKL